MPSPRLRPTRPADLPAERDVLQAWGDGRISWWEVMWWSEDGGLATIAAAARKAGVAWASASSEKPAADGGGGPDGPDYDSDFSGWANHQTDLLLRHLAGDPYAAGGIDWANLADEIADVARSLVREGEDHLARALAYVAKIAADPDHPAARHWHTAAREHLRDAELWLDKPGLRVLVDLATPWHAARRIAAYDLGLDGWHPTWPEALPFLLDELLAEDLDLVLLPDRLRLAAASEAEARR